MKRLFPLSLAAFAAVLLVSSCVYDPLYTGSYGSSYYPASYHGGYYNGVYSDFYLGYHNRYYRYRHTRCRHCNHYPCRGGHSARYYTYYRNYAKPLYGRPHRHSHGHNRYHASAHRGHAAAHAHAHPASYQARRTQHRATRAHIGDSVGHFGRFRGSSSRSEVHRHRGSSVPRGPRSNSQGTHQSPSGSPPRTRNRDSGDRSATPRVNPSTVISTPRVAPPSSSPVVKRSSNSSSSSSSSSPSKRFSASLPRGRSADLRRTGHNFGHSPRANRAGGRGASQGGGGDRGQGRGNRGR